MRAILSEATLRYYMKHCNFRFDESKGEWTPKKDESLAGKTDKIDKLKQSFTPLKLTARHNTCITCITETTFLLIAVTDTALTIVGSLRERITNEDG